MDFSFTDEQQLLQDSIRRYLETSYTLEHRAGILASEAGWSTTTWAELAELGLLALDIDEADGGIGAGPVGTMLVAQAIGAALDRRHARGRWLAIAGVEVVRLPRPDGALAACERACRRWRRCVHGRS